MKRNLTILLIAAMAASALMLGGCGGKDSEEAEETEEITEETSEETAEEEEETTNKSKKSDKDEDDDEDEDKSSGDVPEGGTEIKLSSNQNKAKEVPEDTKLYGSISSGSYWFAFTTDDDEDADYRLTIVNKTPSSEHITAAVYDEYGSEFSSADAENSGTANTFEMGELEPETTYYVCLESLWDREADFMLIIRNFNGKTSSILDGDSSSAEKGSVVLATNMDDAGLVPVDSKVEANIEEGYQYYAFIPEMNGEYRITLVNEAADSEHVTAAIYDEYGEELSSGDAGNDGTANTFSMGSLKAEEAYYIRISSLWDREADYTFTIREPEEPEPDAVAEIVDAE